MVHRHLINVKIVLLWAVCTLPLLAQGGTLPGQKEPEPKSYVPSYFLVGLGLALGLVAICRPGKRRREVRRIIE